MTEYNQSMEHIRTHIARYNHSSGAYNFLMYLYFVYLKLIKYGFDCTFCNAAAHHRLYVLTMELQYSCEYMTSVLVIENMIHYPLNPDNVTLQCS